MSPVDFIRGGDHYNDPIGEHQAAIDEPIKITDGKHTYEVLSYYVDNYGRYVLNIKKVKK
jgi:hypothetical protein